ncbi:hypothetical protein [Bandra megavirus]|uniref:Uncharacterized protein n=1 Tax=Bandra megavirus TaxID=2071566 RepID=A0A2K9V748_9VIRU|nr:hypothetical protein [Bandra megavirus]
MSLDVNDIAVSALLDTKIEIFCLDLALLKLGLLGDLLGTLSITPTLLGLASHDSSLRLGVKTLTSLMDQLQVIIGRFDKIDFILELNGFGNRNKVLSLVSVHVD